MADPNVLPTYADAHKSILDEIDSRVKQRDQEGAFGRESVIKAAAERLGRFGDRQGGRLLMAAWDDLYRSGVVNHGRDMANLGANWAHLSVHGHATLRNIDRDPANARGYLATINPHIANEAIALSYLTEALDTYNKGSVKASAVMLGCTAEALSLSLRDRLERKIRGNGGTPPAAFSDWRIATVLRAMEQQLDARVSDMPRDLRERYESFWTAWTGLFRMTRNAAGHPKSIDPVTREAIHGHLLLFHEHARLVFDLGTWIDSTF